MHDVGGAPLEVRVWGELACFTRPEAKVERVSYPCPTPSAARGILEAIFWKPQFRWLVREIWVLRPIRFFSIVRNEVNSRASPRSARSWAPGEAYYAEEDRAQRHTLALRDVDYLIRAEVEVKPGVGDDPAKYRDQFRRRVRRGACAYAPYLGTRECVASFGPRRGDESPIPVDVDIGRMLFDLDYAADGSGRGEPRFFEARLERGVLRVPAGLYGGH
ncbi:MAG TPA: type I-C CRISPR-associated protein Cas5c [Candidatus Dormibacteraeota bacterium]|nr:type I-C CRISPR-associated protein Cas5c [Candidatus Dormibacteraeota bacterium]